MRACDLLPLRIDTAKPDPRDGPALRVAVGPGALATEQVDEVAADLLFAALDPGSAPDGRAAGAWRWLVPQSPPLRHAVMLAGVAHAAVYLPAALQLGLAVHSHCAPPRENARAPDAALGKQLSGWLMALGRLPLKIARARADDLDARLLASARHALNAAPRGSARIEDMASACGLSRSQLLRTFRRGCGLPPGRYRSELRLRRAALLLLEGERCASAASAAGYRSESQFSLEFSRLYGVRPSRIAGVLSPAATSAMSVPPAVRKVALGAGWG